MQALKDQYESTCWKIVDEMTEKFIDLCVDDNNSQYGNFVTGSLVYGLSLTPQWRATVGANTGFRAPNFNELYWPVTPFYAGNPLLQPEKSRNIEMGLKYTTEKTQLSIREREPLFPDIEWYRQCFKTSLASIDARLRLPGLPRRQY